MSRWISLAVVAVILPLRVPVSIAGDSEVTYGEGRKIAEIESKVINESSGLACGRANKDTFWTHNDSGGKPQVYAFGPRGEELATVTVPGAQARDWEDLASFSHGGQHFLLIADTGDNDAKRESYTLYVVPEPKLRGGTKPAELTATPAQTIRFRYEDGSHNCESAAVDPQTRAIYLVSKVPADSCKVYTVPWPAQKGKSTAVARAVATLNIPTTTAMDISPDGRRAIVLTYGDAFEFTRGAKETWDQAFSRPPRQIKMPPRAAGESICYGADGKTLYLTSECKDKSSGNPSPLLEVPVRQ